MGRDSTCAHVSLHVASIRVSVCVHERVRARTQVELDGGSIGQAFRSRSTCVLTCVRARVSVRVRVRV